MHFPNFAARRYFFLLGRLTPSGRQTVQLFTAINFLLLAIQVRISSFLTYQIRTPPWHPIVINHPLLLSSGNQQQQDNQQFNTDKSSSTTINSFQQQFWGSRLPLQGQHLPPATTMLLFKLLFITKGRRNKSTTIHATTGQQQQVGSIWQSITNSIHQFNLSTTPLLLLAICYLPAIAAAIAAISYYHYFQQSPISPLLLSPPGLGLSPDTRPNRQHHISTPSRAHLAAPLLFIQPFKAADSN